MSSLVSMPTENELAEVSHSELNACIHIAFYQWQQALQMGRHTAESEQIYQAFENERLKRLGQFEKYLMELTAQL